jgi:membrane-bound ClpP family serine protease
MLLLKEFFESSSFLYIMLLVAFALIILELLTASFGLLSIVGCAMIIFFTPLMGQFVSLSYILIICGIFFIIIEAFIGFIGVFFFIGVCVVLTGLIIHLRQSFIMGHWLEAVFLVIVLAFICFAFYLGVRKIVSLKRKSSPFFTLVGKKGKVIDSFVNGEGQCFIDGAIWRCKAQHSLKKDTFITVIEQDFKNNFVTVKEEELSC